MSFRTLKARPKPNLDLTNKRRPFLITDHKLNEEITKKIDSPTSSEHTPPPKASSDEGTCLADSVTDTNCGDNESTTSSSLNEEVTTSRITSNSATIAVAKLKPRPRPNLALGSRSNNSVVTESQKNSTNSQKDTEDCVIVGVSYTNGDIQQDDKVTSSNTGAEAAVVSSDSVKLPSTDIQRNISAKLKARPKPNLIAFNRSKRPLPVESTSTPTAAAADQSSVTEHVKDIKDVRVNSTKPDVNQDEVTVISSKERTDEKKEAEEEKVPDVEDVKSTDNINSSVLLKQENRKIAKKYKKKRKTRKVRLNIRLLALRGKLRSLVRALEFLKKYIAKKKEQINLQKLNKSEISKYSCDVVKRKNVLIRKKIKRMIKVVKTIKQKLKRSAMRMKLKDGLLYRKLLRVVLNEIDRLRKSKAKTKRKFSRNSVLNDKKKKQTFLDKQKQTAIQIEKSHRDDDDENAEVSETVICESQVNKDNSSSDCKEEVKTDVVLTEKKNKIQKIRCKINPMITKPSGVKSMRIKIFKDDGTSVKSELKSSISAATKQSTTEESCSPSKDVKNNTASHSRRFSMNTVKPNLATANRNYKPIQYTTSYGKLNNAVKQKFKDKFGSKKPPEHSKLTMLDLIFYNPSTNPMSAEKDKKKDLQSKECEISNEDSKQGIKSEEKSVNEVNKVPPTEEVSEEEQNETSTALDTNGLPVPQLKITADGKVIIAPESLVVPGKNDDAIKNESRPLIVENDLTHHKVFNKKTKLEKKVWTFQETLKFYKVLNETGSDFLSMASHFPYRTRNCLKRKFKREEKINGELIDKVIGSRRIDFSHVEKELALNQMWDEVEKSCKRRSKYMPEIPDVNKGSISEMFLTKKERELKATTNGETDAVKDETNTKPGKPEKIRKTVDKKKRKPKVLRLKEYLSDNVNNDNTKKTFQINFKCLEQPESTNVSSDDDDEEETRLKANAASIPIVVNTRIESSGIKYTKSVTFNPANMDLPVDINETIAHTSGGGGGDEHQPCPSSTEIIQEIVDILSTDERPAILNDDISESDQSISTESGNACEESII